MSIVIRIVGEQTNFILSAWLLVYKNHWGKRQNVWPERNY
jgi:hypothetical protein